MYQLKNNFFSGLTVSLAMVPECIAFALVAHISPLIGLYTSFIVGLITALLGGRVGMVSGAAGALAVVSVHLVIEHGIEYLFASVILMGIMQIIFAVFKLGKLIRMVPHSVMLGFVNGLAIVIFISQFTHFKSNGNLIETTELIKMVGLTLLTIGVIVVFPRITKYIPSTLAGIVIVTILVNILGIHTKTLGDLGNISGKLPDFHIPNIPYTWESLKIVFPYAFILASVGLIESLLTLNLVDELTNTPSKPNQESIAQGISNLVVGFFSGMGGCGMIGQSMVNLGSNASNRLSAVFMSLFLLSYILFASHLINQIPLAALAGVMFMIAYETFAWSSLQALKKIPKSDALIVVLVTVTTVFTDLALAVVLGIIIASLVFAWEHAKHMDYDEYINDKKQKVYALKGSLFFVSVNDFQKIFSPATDPKEVIIDFKHAKIVDFSAMQCLEKLNEKYQSFDKSMYIRNLSPKCVELIKKGKGITVEKILTENE